MLAAHAPASNFAYSINCLVAGTNLFSVSIMAVFYVGLLTLGYCFYHIAGKLEVPVNSKTVNKAVKNTVPTKTTTSSNNNDDDDDDDMHGSTHTECRESPLANIVTPEIIKQSRENKYRNVVKKNDVMETILWLSVLSFFGSPHGIFCLYGILHICSGFNNLEAIKGQSALFTFVSSSLITAGGSIVTFIPFARLWDKFYLEHPELRCQQGKEYKPQGLWRLEVRRWYIYI